MNVSELHSWNVTPKEAAAEQLKLAGQVEITEFRGKISLVAGTDLSYDRANDMLFAAVLVFSFPDLELIETQSTIAKSTFPYVPGLLSYRELPPLLECFRKLRNVPDIVLCDGQGIAHPRRFGLASHLGILLKIPTVGCAKSRLTGSGNEPGLEKGKWSPLNDEGEEIGRIVRTRTGVKPMYISVGHLCDIETATEVTIKCCIKYRQPEPNRLAHHEVNSIRKYFIHHNKQ